MKANFKPAVLAAVLATSALAALAQPAGPGPGAGPGTGPGMQRQDPERRARMQDHMVRRAAELKAKLKLTAEQEGNWNAYITAMKPPANPPVPKREDIAKLSTPERLDKMRELRKLREAEFDKRDAATRSFYDSLNADQKKVFDDNTGRPFHEGRQWGQR